MFTTPIKGLWRLTTKFFNTEIGLWKNVFVTFVVKNSQTVLQICINLSIFCDQLAYLDIVKNWGIELEMNEL